MPSQPHNIRLLATAIAAGPLDDPAEIIARTKPMIGDLRKARWLRSLATQLSTEFSRTSRPPLHRIAERIRQHEPFIKAWAEGKVSLLTACPDPQMAAAAGAPRSWQLPALTTLRELADELQLHLDDLGWLSSPAASDHYLHRWHSKPKTGGFRLIELPKPLLKLSQRRILERILNPIPPHEAARGFRRGSSVRDFVEPHTRKPVVIRMDLSDFFPSISSTRVLRLFLTAGFPETIARALTRLTTRSTPYPALLQRPIGRAQRRRLRSPHLPQGAPTSPALANLCAFRLDCRLAGLARAAGADYTRYADDLLFSGDSTLSRQASRFLTSAAAIVIEEGFLPNHRKSRILRPGQRQQAAGLVLNAGTNIKRRDYDQLKAILTNCVRSGPASQNRRQLPDFSAHLQGRIAWVKSIHPSHGAKLEAIYRLIDWQRPNPEI